MRIIRWLATGTVVLLAFFCIYLFRGDVIETSSWMLQVLGPTAPALLGLGAYVVVVMVRTYIEAPQLSADNIMDRLDHANDIGEVAGIAGLLGTILAMAAASIAGKPDLAGFLQSLTSTLIGSAINALVIFVSSLMRLKLAGCKS